MKDKQRNWLHAKALEAQEVAVAIQRLALSPYLVWDSTALNSKRQELMTIIEEINQAAETDGKACL